MFHGIASVARQDWPATYAMDKGVSDTNAVAPVAQVNQDPQNQSQTRQLLVAGARHHQQQAVFDAYLDGSDQARQDSQGPDLYDWYREARVQRQLNNWLDDAASDATPSTPRHTLASRYGEAATRPGQVFSVAV
ncbi:hypothetical protein ABHF91_00505 [Pseudaeromonas sp. ZJS20]|uniref:hypothetical protein n=1 Tax=Pseudaeromonas aegiceratis TaxID=3153928 RepID=UPI00390C6541